MSPTDHSTAPETKATYPLVAALCSARKTKHITQAELAQQAGLSRMTVQRLESNGLDPRLSTLQEMARVLEHELVAIPSHLHDSFLQWLELQDSPKDYLHCGSFTFKK